MEEKKHRYFSSDDEEIPEDELEFYPYEEIIDHGDYIAHFLFDNAGEWRDFRFRLGKDY